MTAADPIRAPDRIRVHPGTLSGTVTVPGDKSLSHRALLLAALADGPCSLEGLADSSDVAATAVALGSMGATVTLTAVADGSLSGTVDGELGEPGDVVDCGNSGTSLRLLAGVAAGIDGLSVLTGDESLRRRPVERIRIPLEAMGARLWARAGDRRPPLVVRGGRLSGIEHRSPVASAQVKSCVLLAGLVADGPTTIISPGPSRDHTERMLGHLGRPVERALVDGAERVRVEPGPVAAGAVQVSADPSSAAFWIVAATIGDGDICVPGVCVNPTRTGFVRVLEQMGAQVHSERTREVCGEPVADLHATASPLGAARVEGPAVVDAIDELPILAVAGACGLGGFEVRDAAELRVKESDRIRTLARALGAMGVDVEEFEDGYRVAGGQRPTGGRVDAQGDHRIAMTAAIAATVATGPVEIEGFAAVASSYPGFLDDFERLGGRVERLSGPGPARAGSADDQR
jgi:3-phosphoshikimate 1-carboxyvinyltransferase